MLVKVEEASLTKEMFLNFVVVNATSICDIVIGIPTLNSMKAMISTDTLEIQFKITEGLMI